MPKYRITFEKKEFSGLPLQYVFVLDLHTESIREVLKMAPKIVNERHKLDVDERHIRKIEEIE